jgi:hypothetical protein
MRRPFLFKINFTQWSRRVAFASSRSQFGCVRHQVWPEYCLFLQTWIPPQACDSRPWSGPGHRTRGFLFCISSLTHPAACPRFDQYAPRTATKGSAAIQNRSGRRGQPRAAIASPAGGERRMLGASCFIASNHELFEQACAKTIGSPIKTLIAGANFGEP